MKIKCSSFFKPGCNNYFKVRGLKPTTIVKALRPNDLMNCNTYNDTERLNLELQYEDLGGYENCTLSEVLTIMMEGFIPKLYQSSVTMYVRFTLKHKISRKHGIVS